MPTTRSTVSAAQLGFGLAPDGTSDASAALPVLAIAPEWKDQQRLWGHAFHPMCSYLASFPAALTHAFVGRYSRRGDVVLDPFSGRGTTPLQACAEGRIGVGNDLNPFAHLLTSAKVEPATRAEARRGWRRCASAGRHRAGLARARERRPRGRRLARRGPRAGRGRRPAGPRVEPVPAEVALAFHPRTLAQLLFVRIVAPAWPTGPTASSPPRSRASSTARARRTCRELMPNTFSMAPRYVRDFAARTALRLAGSRRVRRPRTRSSTRLYRDPLPAASGIALLGDARDAAAARASRASRPRPAGPGPARRHLAAVPARRQVRLLQLAADVVPRLRREGHRRDPRRRPPP